MMLFVFVFFSLTLLAKRPEMHRNNVQMRKTAVFIPELRLQLEQNLM